MAYPWLTANDLIAAVQRKISFPIAQNTFSTNDILAFANEEMFISQVPSIMVYHEEYFVTQTAIPLQPNQSIYTIPNRAIGLRIRNVFWGDGEILAGSPYGNLFEMTRVSPDDAAFFQRNIGANVAIHKFYIQGNSINLLPTVQANPTGFMVFMYFLRPNQLVTNDNAATITNFVQTITIDNALVNNNDTIKIGNFYQRDFFLADYIANNFQSGGNPPTFPTPQYFPRIPNFFTENPSGNTYTYPPNVILGGTTFTARTTTGGTITNIVSTAPGSTSTLITSANHGLTTAQYINITGSNSTPSVDGQHQVAVMDANTFVINVAITAPGNTGTWTSPNQFQIGATSTITAQNFSNAITAFSALFPNFAISSTVGSPATNVLTLSYSDRNVFAITNNIKGFAIPTSISVQFDQIPPSITASSLIDVLQTLPGHKTYSYDINVESITGTVIPFNQPDIPYDVRVGDYICAANTCIIPQIPPDFHNVLAERTGARILSAIGDQQGLAAVNAKIAEMEKSQGILVDNRVDGSPQKINARHAILRYQKLGTRRRV